MVVFRAKKSLGQNFLTAPGVISAIVETANITKDDYIVEIGPGKGALTAEILKKEPKRLIAIEKDEELGQLLKETFVSSITEKRLEILIQDALEYIPEKDVLYKIVANIPYNITGLLLRHFLGNSTQQPESMTLVVQKEIAERIARDAKESLLSLSVKAYGTPRYIKTISPRAFRPQPRVHSAILSITDISREHFPTSEYEELFFSVIKAAFRHKRKQMKKNLLDTLDYSESTILDALELAHISPERRAEDIPLEQWLDFVDKLQSSA